MRDPISGMNAVHYLPILTTLFSAFFLWDIFSRFILKRGAHLFWWSLGVFTYGLGTFFEAYITLFGNGPLLNKSWYVAGAILGGYPLAQGSVYLHFSRKTANLLTFITLPFIAFAAICVYLSPVDLSLLESFRPGGGSLEWTWVRLLTPVINSYSAIFLIGSAAYSAIRYAKVENGRNRAIGNSLITLGALLPGIGGSMAKAGIVEALYIGEFVGLILIWLGYKKCLEPLAKSVQEDEVAAAER